MRLFERSLQQPDSVAGRASDAPAQRRERDERGRRGCLGFLFAMIWGSLKLAAVIALAMALVGIFSYHTVRRHVQGRTVVTPLVVNETLFEAAALLAEQGLGLELERTEYEVNTPEGIVLNQNPPPDTPVKVGAVVRVVASAGAALVSVPDVRGLDYKEAEIRLEQAGLRGGRKTSMESLNVPRGAVLTSEPPPRAAAARRAPVHLLISAGPPPLEIAMPRLRGRTLQEASETLSRLGLRIAETRVEFDDEAPDGVIVHQSPEAGLRVDGANPIVVTIVRRSTSG